MDKLTRAAVLVTCFLVSTWAGSQMWNSQAASTRPEKPRIETIAPGTMVLPAADVAALGAESAGVAVVEFSDYECPFCRRHATLTLPELKKRFIDTGQVRYFFRHLPGESHPNAAPAAAVSECARLQGKFWPMHDLLFQVSATQPVPVRDQDFTSHARSLALDAPRFTACLADAGKKAVDVDQREAARLEATGTPAFFIGVLTADGGVDVRRRVRGAAPIEVFDEVIREVRSER